MVIVSRPSPDAEVFAQAHKENVEPDQRFKDLHAALDSGQITKAEWSRRSSQMVEAPAPR
jgi:hypothetical protein